MSAAYLAVSELLIQVVDTVIPHMALPEWVPSFVIIALLIGSPIALIFAWASESTPKEVKWDSDITPKDIIAAPEKNKINDIILAY